MPYFWADRSDFKTVLEKIAQCFPSGITQFLNQHTSKYQKRSKHFVCTRFPGMPPVPPDYCESLCLSDETVKTVGPFYLVSMPGEVKYPTQGVNV